MPKAAHSSRGWALQVNGRCLFWKPLPEEVVDVCNAPATDDSLVADAVALRELRLEILEKGDQSQ